MEPPRSLRRLALRMFDLFSWYNTSYDNLLLLYITVLVVLLNLKLHNSKVFLDVNASL
jgi:hypothetical protein